MGDSGFLSALFIGLVSSVLSLLLVAVGFFLGPQRSSQARLQSQVASLHLEGRGRLHVPFHALALLFLIFQAAAVCLLPWAILFREYLDKSPSLAYFAIGVISLFGAIVGLGFIFAWRRGVCK